MELKISENGGLVAHGIGFSHVWHGGHVGHVGHGVGFSHVWHGGHVKHVGHVGQVWHIGHVGHVGHGSVTEHGGFFINTFIDLIDVLDEKGLLCKSLNASAK